MRTAWWQQQQGVAMLVELVLLAAVLSLVGVALYMANNYRANTSDLVQQQAATPNQAAETAAKAVEKDALDEAELAAEAEASAEEFTASETDINNLGDSFNEDNF